MVTTSSMSASVMRRPFTILLSMPRAAATLVARRPPPCTNTFLPGMAAKSFKSCASFSLSSTMAPPTFTTVTFSILSYVECLLKISVSEETIAIGAQEFLTLIE